jgi:hypothetical protein
LFLVKGLFFYVLILNQSLSPASQISSFRLQYFPYYVCDFLLMLSFVVDLLNFFLEWHQTFSLYFCYSFAGSGFSGIILRSRFHIRCTSVHKLLYFSFFSSSFCTTFLSVGTATSISVHVFIYLFIFFFIFFLFYFFNYYIWPVCCNFSVCV